MYFHIVRQRDTLNVHSPQVRRRTLLAYRTLSEQNTDILKKILDKMRKRLNDENLSVVGAALTISITLIHVRHLSLL